MQQYKVGIIGATGMVGQRFITLLSNHLWFSISVLAASPNSAGKPYEQALGGRWTMPAPLPDAVKNMVVLDAADVSAVSSQCDFVFCAVDMDKAETRALEEAYAKAETPVISNNSACRMLADVPMMVPEINPTHVDVIAAQRKRLGTNVGFIAAKSNCSIQSYVPPLTPLLAPFGVKRVLACTYQAISGAGKNFTTWPEMVDNVIPFIGGEEQKSEEEPLKIWGTVENGVIVNAQSPVISSQCYRVPVTDGHLAAVYVDFEKKPTIEEILSIWDSWVPEPQQLKLPSAPEKFLTYFGEEDRPQTRLDRDLYGGMGVSIGRLREDNIFDYKFACLSHNTLRGAAGGGVLMAEYLCAKGFIPNK
ncbi:aspartate-semialdehyde dehydrogenase [Eubacteriales bacterium OttesenSCG-928-M02]|nr:aspartate-semialdehyde dehydrogenase [Eubacteriales bacterium OttesenSCG-928-M02]